MRDNESSNVCHAKKPSISTKTLWINFLSKMRVDKSSDVNHAKKHTFNVKSLWINLLSKMEASIVSMNHCEVCKTVVKNLKKHIETQKHRKAINNSIISNEYFNTKTKCVTCNRDVQNLKRHERTNAHRKRLNDSILASSFFFL